MSPGVSLIVFFKLIFSRSQLYSIDSKSSTKISVSIIDRIESRHLSSEKGRINPRKRIDRRLEILVKYKVEMFFFFLFPLIWIASLLESTNKLLLSPPSPPLELLGKPTESFYGIARKRGSAFKSVVVSLGRSPLDSLSLSLSLSSSFPPIKPFSLFSLASFFPSRYHFPSIFH